MENIFGEGTVITTEDQLQEGSEYAIIPVEQLPEKLQASIPEGAVVVVAGQEDLVEGATYVPTGEVVDDSAREGIIKTIFGIGEVFIPGLAAWEGVGLLLSKRKRDNYKKAVKAVTPTKTNPEVDVLQALLSILAGMGLAHSSPDSKAVFEGTANVEDNTAKTVVPPLELLEE